ncbi:hypothetical protein V8G54_016250 [Vigna mungo]|uniref:Uncharacterized protein n=1 Tax=Vigna mungo TaxID=3915 RepID=A0AAQ3NKW5_VIGMU
MELAGVSKTAHISRGFGKTAGNNRGCTKTPLFLGVKIAAVKIALPRRIVSASPRKTLVSVSHLFSPMEVEVKLRLADTNAHHRVNNLLSPFHVVTHRQKNLFFNGAASEVFERRAVLCLRFYGDDERRVEEDEEDLDPRIGCEYVAEPRKLKSRVLRVKEEFGTKKGFIGLGEDEKEK